MAEDRGSIRVRMYRQGLGDCFLISVLDRPKNNRGEKPRPFHMMIDCGVILGTPDAEQRMRAVVNSVIEETGGFLDVLVVTHEHYDHVSGFILARDLFALPVDAGATGKLSVGEVWFAWTENPANPVANELRRERATQLWALRAMAFRLDAEATNKKELDAALSFFGIDPTDTEEESAGDGLAAAGGGRKLSQTAQAMLNAAALAPAGRLRYLEPGAVVTPEAVRRELRFRVLGPPLDRKSLRRTDSTSEVYHLDARALEASVLLAASAEDAARDQVDSPFGKGWAFGFAGLEKHVPHSDDEDAHAFFRELYLGDDDKWRRIDDGWLGSTEALALALDGATNNTSLVLAIELVDSREVLLFVGDAQVGNWLSWEHLLWIEDAREGSGVVSREMKAADLLGRTVFYKVGHHGSHNATLRARGVDLMPEQGLTSFVPVDAATARKRHWDQMPLKALLKALESRGEVVRLDEDAVGSTLPGGKPGEGWGFDSLYFDWTRPISPAG